MESATNIYQRHQPDVVMGSGKHESRDADGVRNGGGLEPAHVQGLAGKGELRDVLGAADQARALRFFEQWEKQALKLELAQATTLAKTLRRYLPGLLAYQLYRITNAISEGFNSKIQALKAAARGFRNVANYRIRILFFCGKLDFSH